MNPGAKRENCECVSVVVHLLWESDTYFSFIDLDSFKPFKHRSYVVKQISQEPYYCVSIGYSRVFSGSRYSFLEMVAWLNMTTKHLKHLILAQTIISSKSTFLTS